MSFWESVFAHAFGSLPICYVMWRCFHDKADFHPVVKQPEPETPPVPYTTFEAIAEELPKALTHPRRVGLSGFITTPVNKG